MDFGRIAMDLPELAIRRSLLSFSWIQSCRFVLPVTVLVMAVLSASPCLADSNSENVLELLDRQSRSPDGVIRFDDSSVRQFIEFASSRSYSLIIFFDALQLRDNAELRLEDRRREFGLVATTYIRNNEGKDSASKVFFVDIEFKQSQASFNLFGVNTLPHIKHMPPGSVKPKDGDTMDQSDMARSGEGMASFVESKTKQKVGTIERPPPITKKQLIILAGGLLVAAPFVIKKLMTGDTPLHDPKVWASFALFVYFFSVSGGMHNIIRSMPLFMADRNNPGKLVFFYQGSGMQLGAEGFVVGFLYTVFGLALAFVTHFLVEVKNQTTQRGILLVCMVLLFWAVRKVIFLDNWKTGYGIHGYWPNRWR